MSITVEPIDTEPVREATTDTLNSSSPSSMSDEVQTLLKRYLKKYRFIVVALILTMILISTVSSLIQTLPNICNTNNGTSSL